MCRDWIIKLLTLCVAWCTWAIEGDLGFFPTVKSQFLRIKAHRSFNSSRKLVKAFKPAKKLKTSIHRDSTLALTPPYPSTPQISLRKDVNFPNIMISTSSRAGLEFHSQISRPSLPFRFPSAPMSFFCARLTFLSDQVISKINKSPPRWNPFQPWSREWGRMKKRKRNESFLLLLKGKWRWEIVFDE